ncbi:MAG: invasion-associated locus B family protein [Ancylobacter novellus]|uniref:Invasion-associated locus B family protein n=1 Tax=Ancylobacter novellus TaxID=921 RepID=A0A2W5R8T7_ANCNO|nr:MAG: invasion-associated locus B family protein [Ancylobacter novellus]
MRRSRCSAAGLLALALVATAAFSHASLAQQAPAQPAPAAPRAAAPAGNAPQSTTATYQDWIVRCETRAEGPKVCEIAQGIQAQGQQGLVAQIALGRLSKTDPYHLVIQLPAGVWLPTGVSLQFEDKTAPIALPFTRCLQVCIADLELKPDQINVLKARTARAQIAFEDGARNKVQLPISFNGFAAALEASQKD